MSDYTNKDIFTDTNFMLNRLGGEDDKLRNNEKYIQEQLDLIKDANSVLPPENITYDENNTSHVEDLNSLFASDYQNIKTGRDAQLVQDRSDPKVLLKSYEPLDRNRYDPYVDFLHKEGLLNENNIRRFKHHFIDFNSVDRVSEPSLHISENFTLDPDPLIFTENSRIMFINHSGHNFQVNDRITLNNVTEPIHKYAARDSADNLLTFEMGENTRYMRINFFNNHNIPNTVSFDETTITVDLDGYFGRFSTYIGDIPEGLVNKEHVVFVQTDPHTGVGDGTPENIPAEDQILVNGLKDSTVFDAAGNYTPIVYDPTKFWVRLGRRHNGSTAQAFGHIFTVQFNSISGIPINYINATYPLSINNIRGLHTIQAINEKGYFVELPLPALYNVIGAGGNCVEVERIEEVRSSYSNPNQYRLSLPNTLTNIISASLVSSIFPNARYVIRSTGEHPNNKIYWQNLDDGAHVYSISIPDGNYNPTELIAEMESLFINTQRINFETDQTITEISNYTNKNFIKVDIDTKTNIVTFTAFRETSREDSIFPINVQITDVDPDTLVGNVSIIDDSQPVQLFIEHPSHGLVVGDTILIADAIETHGITADIINSEFVVVNIDDLFIEGLTRQGYTVTLDNVNVNAVGTQTFGGNSTLVYNPLIFRMDFTESDTLGTELGFRNVGDNFAITPYSNVSKNINAYDKDINIDESGQELPVTNNFVKLSGDDYIIMVVKQISNASSTGPIKEFFAKIILNDLPAKTVYNTFVEINPVYDIPILELSDLDFEFYSPNGELYDFNGLDHSFTIKFITVNDTLKGTNISAELGKRVF